MFLTELCDERLCQREIPCWEEPNMEEFVRCGIDGGKQTLALIVQLNQGLVERDGIWLLQRNSALDRPSALNCGRLIVCVRHPG